MNAMKNMYKNNPVNLDIAGTIESISKINKEVLYKCYNTFYNPSNMVICFSGDFEPEQIIEEVKKRLVVGAGPVSARATTGVAPTNRTHISRRAGRSCKTRNRSYNGSKHSNVCNRNQERCRGRRPRRP